MRIYIFFFSKVVSDCLLCQSYVLSLTIISMCSEICYNMMMLKYFYYFFVQKDERLHFLDSMLIIKRYLILAQFAKRNKF